MPGSTALVSPAAPQRWSSIACGRSTRNIDDTTYDGRAGVEEDGVGRKSPLGASLSPPPPPLPPQCWSPAPRAALFVTVHDRRRQASKIPRSTHQDRPCLPDEHWIANSLSPPSLFPPLALFRTSMPTDKQQPRLKRNAAMNSLLPRPGKSIRLERLGQRRLRRSHPCSPRASSGAPPT